MQMQDEGGGCKNFQWGGEGGRGREGLSLIQKSHYFSIHYNLNGPRIIPRTSNYEYFIWSNTYDLIIARITELHK